MFTPSRLHQTISTVKICQIGTIVLHKLDNLYAPHTDRPPVLVKSFFYHDPILPLAPRPLVV